MTKKTELTETEMSLEAADTPDPEFQDAQAFLRGLAGAAESGMTTEYVAFVLRALKRGKTMAESIWYAQCEWDL